jgi:hypothetical protein
MPHQPDAERLERTAAANEQSEGIRGWLIDSLGAVGVMVTALGFLAAIGSASWLMARMRVRKPATASDALHATIKRSPKLASGGSRELAPRATWGNPTDRARVPAAGALDPTRLDHFGTLEVMNGPLAGKRFLIPKGGLLVGRDPTRCAIVLPADSISKEHAWVVPVDNQVVIIDRGSANGTYVNSIDSARVDKTPLRSGDRIYLGKSNPSVLAYLQ